MMTQTKREIERKYEDPSGSTDLPDLTRVPGVASISDKGVVALDATYYDTPDQRLAAGRITLRRRTGGTDEGWHLKLPVSPSPGIRDEIQVPLSAGAGGAGKRQDGPPGGPRPQQPGGAGAARTAQATRAPGAAGEIEAPPDELTSLVRSRVRDAPLRPVIRLRTARRLTHLLDDTNTLLAEVALDRVRAERLSGAPDDGTAEERDGGAGTSGRGRGPGRQATGTAQWTEAEVELADGAPSELLDAVEEHLRTAGWRPSEAPSKLARALAETGAAHPRGPARTSPQRPRFRGRPAPAARPVLDYLRTQRDALVDMDPAVRRDLPDSVHRMRVATRRMRSVLRSYGSVLDRSVTAPVADELKWLAGELGIDRDREVLVERLSAALDRLPSDLGAEPVRDRLESWSDERRGDSRGRVTEVLDGERYLRLLDTLDRLVADPPLRPAALRKPRKVLTKAVRRDRRRLAGRLAEALRRPPGPGRDEALHSARKAAKRLRYTAEAARPVLGTKAKKNVARAKRLQTLLGDHQDSVMARKALEDLSEQAHRARENAFPYGVLYGREEHGAAEVERRVAEREG